MAECKEIMAAGSSMRAAANIVEKTLGLHIKEKGGAVVNVQGQLMSLPLQCEKKLSLMLTIKAKAKWRFAYRFDIWRNIKNEVYLSHR